MKIIRCTHGKPKTNIRNHKNYNKPKKHTHCQ